MIKGTVEFEEMEVVITRVFDKMLGAYAEHVTKDRNGKYLKGYISLSIVGDAMDKINAEEDSDTYKLFMVKAKMKADGYKQRLGLVITDVEAVKVMEPSDAAEAEDATEEDEDLVNFED